MSTATLFPLPVEQAAVDFFYEHAGFSYDPKRETPEEGALRGARNLAEAEAYAEAHEWDVQWDRDYDAEYADAGTEWADWPHYCAAVTMPNEESHIGLGGVMFKDKGDETSDPYARVVRAELFAEAMHEHLRQVEREASR